MVFMTRVNSYMAGVARHVLNCASTMAAIKAWYAQNQLLTGNCKINIIIAFMGFSKALYTITVPLTMK